VTTTLTLSGAATTRPEKLGLPTTRWCLRKLAAYLASCDRPVRAGRERLRQILHARGISFQRTRTWKESTDPDRDAKLDRIEHVATHLPDRAAVDPALPEQLLGETEKPARLGATYQPHSQRPHFHGCYCVGDDQLWGILRRRKGADHTLAALKSIRAAPAWRLPAVRHLGCAMRRTAV
jgi:hypothetical protein